MFSLNKRGTELTIATLIGIILLTLTLVIIIGLIVMVRSSLSAEDWGTYACWASNHLKSSNFFFKSILPSSCLMVEVAKPVNVGGLAKLHVDTWWQYGKGKLDLGNAGDEIIPVYSFYVENDTTLSDLYNYMFRHASGKQVDLEDSDYNYLQKGSLGPTLCFEVAIFQDSATLRSGKRYFLLFLDDQRPHDSGDKVILSTIPTDSLISKLGRGILEADYACVSLVGSKMNFGKFIAGGTPLGV